VTSSTAFDSPQRQYLILVDDVEMVTDNQLVLSSSLLPAKETGKSFENAGIDESSHYHLWKMRSAYQL
jgi:hypothetical protein